DVVPLGSVPDRRVSVLMAMPSESVAGLLKTSCQLAQFLEPLVERFKRLVAVLDCHDTHVTGCLWHLTRMSSASSSCNSPRSRAEGDCVLLHFPIHQPVAQT